MGDISQELLNAETKVSRFEYVSEREELGDQGGQGKGIWGEVVQKGDGRYYSVVWNYGVSSISSGIVENNAGGGGAVSG